MSVFCLNAKHEQRSALKNFTPCFIPNGRDVHILMQDILIIIILYMLVNIFKVSD